MCSIKPISFSYIIYYCVYCNIHASNDILNAFILLIHLDPWNTIDSIWHEYLFCNKTILITQYFINWFAIHTILGFKFSFCLHLWYLKIIFIRQTENYTKGNIFKCGLNNKIFSVLSLFSYERRVFGIYRERIILSTSELTICYYFYNLYMRSC